MMTGRLALNGWAVTSNQGRNHVFKVGGPIPRSRLLYRTKYGWYTQFRALLRKKLGWCVQLFWGVEGVRPPPSTHHPSGCALASNTTRMGQVVMPTRLVPTHCTNCNSSSINGTHCTNRNVAFITVFCCCAQ